MDKKDLKIVFLGTPDFAVESLDRLHTEGYNIAAVITMPDKPAGRGKKLTASPVKEYAVAHGMRLLQPANLKDETFVEELRQIDADLFIVIAFRMLPKVVWQMPRLGTFNLHASLLPKYRGAAPINWAIINGDTETGVTTFFLKHEIDTGDIISRQRIDILPDDDLGTVHDKLMHLGADLTLDTVRHILAGDLQTIPQDSLIGDEEPTPAPKIFKDTCRIDWTRPSRDIHNLVRGLSPYPAAWTMLCDGDAAPVQVKIYRTAVENADCPDGTLPGRVTVKDGRLWVDTADGRIEILSLQTQGKKRMSTPDYLRGARLTSPKFQ